MHLVNVNGFGMVQFPDDVTVDQMRTELQGQFPPIQDVAGVAQPSIADPFAADRLAMEQRQRESQEFQQRQFPDPTVQEPGLGEVIIPGLEDTPADIAFTAKAIQEGDVLSAGIGAAGTLLPGLSAAKLAAIVPFSAIAKEGLDVTKPVRFKRAKEQGFDTGKVWFHGSPVQREIDTLRTGAEFQLRRHGNAFGDGIYITTSTDTANEFARDGQVIPLLKRGELFKPSGVAIDNTLAAKLDDHVAKNFNESEIASLSSDIGTARRSVKFDDAKEAEEFFNTHQANWEHFRGLDRTKPEVLGSKGKFTIEYTDFNAAPTFKGKTGNEVVAALIHVSGKAAGDTLGAAGFDGVAYTAGEAVIFNPKNVRSIHAQFDPSKIEERELLLGLGGLAVGAGALSSTDPQNEGI